MKKILRVGVCLLIISLLCLPAAAEAHRHGSGGDVFFGFGVGLLTGYLFAPRTVVAAPPVYYAPYVPAPAAPPVYGYSYNAPRPGTHAKCREWRFLERHYQDTWDSYYGRWRTVPVEKWGWAEVPCDN